MRLGEVWPGKAEQGLARLGEATVADGSTEHFGVPCCSREGVVVVQRGGAMQGKARLRAD